MQQRCTPRVTRYGEPVTIASAETIGKDQTAGSDHPDHQLVTRYVQNRDSANSAIFVGKIIMAQPSPLSVLSNALKIADKFTVTMEAVGNKIRLNSQGWEDARVLTERQVAMVVAYKGQHYLLPEHRPPKFEHINQTGLHEAGYGLGDFE
jgi:hypothetical protein